MNFDNFRKIVPKIAKIPLPGLSSQLKMAPKMRQKALNDMQERMKNARKSAVMALFYPNNTYETTLVLILRRAYEGVHSNQVGFPGGKAELEDETLEVTALRETEEEVGIPQHTVNVIREITSTYIPPSNFMVQPYIGVVYDTPIFIPQESEVASILEVSLQDLLSEASTIEKKITTSYATAINVPAFYLNEKVVWGATAMMLSEVKDIILEAISN
ncbi:NUDIX hydrolase [Kordia jejudonensis]|uniref:NUDIX hydrolase n=1 Tax=Kordia jejudonensis TaxID=1348245 RepID=UPI0006293E6E|nr:CoA pyrophosphatase [Kordia jejudonensis]